MGWLLGGSKIRGDERQECLAYLEQEWKLTALQEKEADLYNSAVVKYAKSMVTDTRAAREMCRAAKRLAESAGEILTRRGRMASIPDAASAMYLAWQMTYSDYSAWAAAQAAATEAAANGMQPHGEHVRGLLSESEKSRQQAMNEMGRLIKRLKLRGSEMQNLFSNASTAVVSENWQPRKTEECE